MKYLSKLFLLVLAAATFSACEKVPDLPFYASGMPVELTTSTNSIAATATDSNNVALTLTWTNPEFAVAEGDVKYIVEIDSAGRNLSQSIKKELRDTLSTSYLAKELNAILLDDYGYTIGQKYSMDVRVTASYLNNNDQVMSNIVTIEMTPYKVPPRIALPASGILFLVGNATQGDWSNPVPVPTQQFSRLDETTFAGVFELRGGNQYLVLPVNGSWDEKYSVADNQVPGAAEGGDFGYGLPSNFAGPANSGWYKITLDFQTGKYSVVPYEGNLPTNLYIVGDATAGGWNNPVPEPSQVFTRLNSSEFELILPLFGGKQYLLLPQNGSWDHKYAVADASVPGLAMGGELGYDFGQNLPAPAEDGTYKINVNFAAGAQGKFTLTKQ